MNPTVPRWLRIYQPRPQAALRLLCLPHAGGAASFFREWPALMPDQIELVAVQYPGREDRFGDAMVDDMATLCDELAVVVRRHVRPPYALFGHSLGAAVSFETARLLEDSAAGAAWLFASGRHAPQDVRGGTVHLGDDEGLVGELRRLGGTSSELLADPGVREIVLSSLRNDYRLAETYRCRNQRPLACPLTAIVGDVDPEVDPAEAGRWAALTRAAFQLAVLPGDHFYLIRQRRAVTTVIARALIAGSTAQLADRSAARSAARSCWPSTP